MFCNLSTCVVISLILAIQAMNSSALIEHNTTIEREMFLGHELMQKFENMSIEAKIDNLKKLVTTKIDSDANGLISIPELSDWMLFSTEKYLHEIVDNQWSALNASRDSHISFEQYASLNSNTAQNLSNNSQLEQRERQRWKLADLDANDRLNMTEYFAFLHPDLRLHMHDSAIQETMEDTDLNKDGLVDLNEFMKSHSHDHYYNDNGTEPEWVKSKRNYFIDKLDANKDGYLNTDEIRKWIIPEDTAQIEAEVIHLFDTSDSNKDNFLNMDEILSNYEHFVGGMATDFGTDILHLHQKNSDEL